MAPLEGALGSGIAHDLDKNGNGLFGSRSKFAEGDGHPATSADRAGTRGFHQGRDDLLFLWRTPAISPKA